MGDLEPVSIKKSQKMGSLRAIKQIKKKMCRKLKGRTCADVNPQRCYIPKYDASYPTISLD